MYHISTDGNYRLSACPGQVKMVPDKQNFRNLEHFSEGKAEIMEITLCLFVEDWQK